MIEVNTNIKEQYRLYLYIKCEMIKISNTTRFGLGSDVDNMNVLFIPNTMSNLLNDLSYEDKPDADITPLNMICDDLNVYATENNRNKFDTFDEFVSKRRDDRLNKIGI